MNIKILNDESLSKVTKKVVNDFNTISDKEFFRKYSVSKRRYLKRFIKYGDPYMNAPLAKFGKFLKRLQSK
mgnify:CR=1 FL=1